MITYVYSDILQSPARVLVNPVNTVGVMGQGLAYDFKRCYPAMFDYYRDACSRGDLTPGRLLLYRTAHKWVLNFPTKRHWRSSARLDDIEAGLRKFASIAAAQGIASISFPALGTGGGGLDWAHAVQPLMERYLAPLPVMAYIHLRDAADPYWPQDRNIRTLRAWLEGDPQPVSFDKLWRDINRALKQRKEFTTPDGARFTVGADTRRRGRKLVILTGSPQPLFVSESMLADAWAYIRSAGYCLPGNLPGGLDAHAPVIVALFAALEYARPVHILDGDGHKHTGLHYIPPVERRAVSDARKITLRPA